MRIAGFWKEGKIITKTNELPRIWFGRPVKELTIVPVKFEANYRFWCFTHIPNCLEGRLDNKDVGLIRYCLAKLTSASGISFNPSTK